MQKHLQCSYRSAQGRLRLARKKLDDVKEELNRVGFETENDFENIRNRQEVLETSEQRERVEEYTLDKLEQELTDLEQISRKEAETVRLKCFEKDLPLFSLSTFLKRATPPGGRGPLRRCGLFR